MNMYEVSGSLSASWLYIGGVRRHSHAVYTAKLPSCSVKTTSKGPNSNKEKTNEVERSGIVMDELSGSFAATQETTHRPACGSVLGSDVGSVANNSPS